MTRVERIRGVPGTGKTYTVMGRVADHVEQGYGANDFLVVSFTNSHADDLKQKLRKRGWAELFVNASDSEDEEYLYEKQEEQTSTLHSQVVSTLSVKSENIICPQSNPESDENELEPYEEFFGSIGVQFAERRTDPLVIYRDGRQPTKGMTILAVEQWLALHDVIGRRGGDYLDGITPRAVAWTPFEVADEDGDVMPADRVADIIREWREYKQSETLYEHHDYMAAALEEGVTPTEPVIVVDEMQDYAPVEYLVIRQWIDDGNADYVYLCGDEWQSIYSFKGARPEYLTDTEVDDETDPMRVSRRCPAAIANVVRGVHPATEMLAKDPGGTVDDPSITDDAELAELVLEQVETHPPNDREGLEYGLGDKTRVMVLCRTNQQLGKIADALRRQGVPFSALSGAKMGGVRGMDDESWSWHDDLLDIAKALRSLHTGPNVPADVAEQVMEHVIQSDRRFERADWQTSFLAETTSGGAAVNLASAFPDCATPVEIIDALDLPDIEREMLRGVVANPKIELEPELVKIGTIHDSKGRESPCTILTTGYVERLANRWESDKEFRREERNLYYVGTSRAKQTLILARDYVGSQPVPLFADGEIPRYADDASAVIA